MSAADVLRRAADHIEEVGWIQGSSYSGEPSSTACCVLGAIQQAAKAVGDTNDYWNARGAFADFVLGAGRGADDTSGWNDEPGRTVSDVTTALRSAADVLAPVGAGGEHQ